MYRKTKKNLQGERCAEGHQLAMSQWSDSLAKCWKGVVKWHMESDSCYIWLSLSCQKYTAGRGTGLSNPFFFFLHILI